MKEILNFVVILGKKTKCTSARVRQKTWFIAKLDNNVMLSRFVVVGDVKLFTLHGNGKVYLIDD